MPVKLPQIDRKVVLGPLGAAGISGGSDLWDTGLVGELLIADWFAAGLYLATSDGGSSTDSGGLTVSYRASVVDAGSSSDTGNLTVQVRVATVDTGTSTDSGVLRTTRWLATVDTGASTLDGQLAVIAGLATIDNGFSTDTGTLAVRHGTGQTMLLTGTPF